MTYITWETYTSLVYETFTLGLVYVTYITWETYTSLVYETFTLALELVYVTYITCETCTSLVYETFTLGLVYGTYITCETCTSLVYETFTLGLVYVALTRGVCISLVQTNYRPMSIYVSVCHSYLYNKNTYITSDYNKIFVVDSCIY